MAKLSKAQQYLLGFLQRGEYKLYVNRPARVAALRPVSGVLSNPIYITLAQADGLINRDAVLEEDANIYIDNPEFERVPLVMKSVRNCGYVSYYVEKKIHQKTEDNS